MIYMRMLPSTMEAVHMEMKKVFETYGETELAEHFWWSKKIVTASEE